MRKLNQVLTGVMAVCSIGLAQAEDAEVIEVKRMSMATATQIAQAAVAACQEKGIQVGVTVVDRDGTPQVVLRDTIAAPITLPISKDKAYTAVMFNAATSALDSRADTPIGRVPGLMMLAGGLPIAVGGSLLGGVGVSGAPASKTDEECAQAGIDAVHDDLEMAL